MKGKNFSTEIQRTKYVLSDWVMTSVAFFVFNVFRYNVLYSVHGSNLSLEQFLRFPVVVAEQILVPLGMMAIYWLSGYYNRPFGKSRLTEFFTTFYSAAAGALIIYLSILIHDVLGSKNLDYTLMFGAFIIIFGFVYLGRWILTQLTLKHLRTHRWIYTTLIVGNSRKSRVIYEKLQRSGSVWCYNVVGFIRLNGEKDASDSMPVWNFDEINKVCRDNKVDQIVIAPERNSDQLVMSILDHIFDLNIPVKIAPDTLSFVTAGIRMDDIVGVPMINLTSPRMSEFQKNVKRSFDVIVSILTLLILSPLLAIIAVSVKCSSTGPVIYRQPRVGLRQKPFMIYKFRSMYIDAESEGPQLSSHDDHRITPIGHLLRKYRLDELPQFWNVLMGEMSIVGPRPERQFFIKQIVKKAPYFRLTFQVRPGITSWGMVKFGYASSISDMVSRSRYDLLYLNNMSLSTDFKIMIYTIKTVFSGEGM